MTALRLAAPLALVFALAGGRWAAGADAASPAVPESPESTLARKLLEGTKALIAALPADLVKENTFAFGGPEHRYWHWIPTPLLTDKTLGKDFKPYGRFGVPVEKMDVKAIGLLHNLLKMGMSGEGYRKVQLIIRQEGPAEPRQAFNALNRKPDWYFFSVFGEVGSAKWGFRFEGHHVSLTYEIENGHKVRFSPSMIGFNPSPLPPKAAELAMGLFNELPADVKDKAQLAKNGGKDIPADCTRSPEAPKPVGVQLANLTEDGKWYLLLLIEEYVGNYPDAIAKAVRKEIHKDLDKLHFAWYGPLDHAQPHFYRLQGPTFLIEMRHQGGGSAAAHIHGVYRSLVDGSVNSTVASAN